LTKSLPLTGRPGPEAEGTGEKIKYRNQIPPSGFLGRRYFHPLINYFFIFLCYNENSRGVREENTFHFSCEVRKMRLLRLYYLPVISALLIVLFMLLWDCRSAVDPVPPPVFMTE
jgi:hypothetical protein